MLLVVIELLSFTFLFSKSRDHEILKYLIWGERVCERRKRERERGIFSEVAGTDQGTGR